MRIGLNLLFLVPKKVGGTETYARGLISSLQKIDKVNQYFLFCNIENQNTFKETKNFKKVVLPVKASVKGLRLVLEQVLFPFFSRKYRLDVLHSLGYSGPFFIPCYSIVTIHDLNWYYYPDDFWFLARAAWAFSTTYSAKFSDMVTTVSYSSKEHLVKILKLPTKKIKVVYSGTPKLEQPFSRKRLKNLRINKKYLFTVSAAYPHKNLITLLKSFNLLRQRGYKLDLVVAGLGGRAKGQTVSYINDNNLDEHVKILGWVSDKDLSTLYKYAEVMVFPSLHEGFGIPLVEAFSQGVPVVSSDAFSLKEVGKETALFVSPLDPSDYAEKISNILDDNELKKKLVKKGIKRSKYFSWEKSSRKMLGIYNSVGKYKLYE